MNKIHDKNMEEINTVFNHYKTKVLANKCTRDIQIFQMLDQMLHAGSDTERKMVEWCNNGKYTRVFVRVCAEAHYNNTYTSIGEVTSRLACTEKTTRNLYSQARDMGMLELCCTKEQCCECKKKLRFKASPETLCVFEKHVDDILFTLTDDITEYFHNCIELLRLYKKHGSDFQSDTLKIGNGFQLQKQT